MKVPTSSGRHGEICRSAVAGAQLDLTKLPGRKRESESWRRPRGLIVDGDGGLLLGNGQRQGQVGQFPEDSRKCPTAGKPSLLTCREYFPGFKSPRGRTFRASSEVRDERLREVPRRLIIQCVRPATGQPGGGSLTVPGNGGVGHAGSRPHPRPSRN